MLITRNYDKDSALTIFCSRDMMDNGLIAELSTRVELGIYSIIKVLFI